MGKNLIFAVPKGTEPHFVYRAMTQCLLQDRWMMVDTSGKMHVRFEEMQGWVNIGGNYDLVKDEVVRPLLEKQFSEDNVAVATAYEKEDLAPEIKLFIIDEIIDADAGRDSATLNRKATNTKEVLGIRKVIKDFENDEFDRIVDVKGSKVKMVLLMHDRKRKGELLLCGYFWNGRTVQTRIQLNNLSHVHFTASGYDARMIAHE